MQNHVTVLSALYIGLGAIGVIAALISAAAIFGGGLLSGDETAIWITSQVSVFVAGIVAIGSVPPLVAGIGLFRREPWSRFVAMVVGFMMLLAFPIGTVVGIYSIWVLTCPETIELLSLEGDEYEDYID